MKVFLILCVLASTQAFPRSPGTSKIGFLEDVRSMTGNRITNGQLATDGQFPHQAYLWLILKDGRQSSCGGSLFNPGWVVTAAHCLINVVEVYVYLGSVYRNKFPVAITSRKLFVHPKYDQYYQFNDIGLIDLGQHAPLSDTIKPIRILPNRDTYVDREATVSGFGLTTNGYPSVLNWVNVKIISNSECKKYHYGFIIDSTICTLGIQYPNQGSCSGDSGGPLTLADGNGDILIGIVSFGGNDCTYNMPKAFVRPNHFTDWITEVSGIRFDKNDTNMEN